MALVEPDGIVKIFGGEPALRPRETTRIMHALRRLGFEGPIYLFSNGDDAATLIELLEASPPACAVLNHSVWEGRGVPALAESARAALLDYERAHPGTIWPGHEQYYACGRATGLDLATDAECARCWPVVLPDGRVHACPFAIETDHPAFRLGDAADDPATIVERFRHFLTWIDGPHAALAASLRLDACTICQHHLHRLPSPF